MENKITTLNDARRIVNAWTENYLERPTSKQIEHASRALIEHVGGIGKELTCELSDSFNLGEVLEDAQTEMLAEYLTKLQDDLRSKRDEMRDLNDEETFEFARRIASELRAEMVADEFDSSMLNEDLQFLKDEFFWK